MDEECNGEPDRGEARRDTDDDECGDGDFEDDFFRGRGRGPPAWTAARFRGRGYGPRPPFAHPPTRFPPEHHRPWGRPGMMGGPYGPPGTMGPGGPPGPMGGPPPNHMMGGSPYGGPPGMGPPPNMAGPELWVETKTEEGKSYFYHARTRETTWTRPQEGPHCKVISQGEVEAMAQGQMGMNGPQNGPMGGPNPGMNGSMGPGGPMGGPMGPNGPMGPPGHVSHNIGPGQMGQMGPPGTQMSPLAFGQSMGGPKSEDSKSIEDEDLTCVNDNSSGQSGHPMNHVSQDMNKLNMMQPGPPGQFALPPPGFPQWGGPPGWPQWQGAPAGPPPSLQAPPELMARVAEWTSHRAPDGRTYYYHAKRQESVWEKPQPLKDFEAFQKSAMTGMAPPGAMNTMASGPVATGATQMTNIGQNLPQVGTQPLKATDADGTLNKNSNASQSTSDESKTDVNGVEINADNRKKEVKKEADEINRTVKDKEQPFQQPAKPQDKSRPVSSTPISGTPWCVVWTGDGRVFFYNPTAHSSVWERPEQLIGRSDVDRAVSNPPENVVELQNSSGAGVSQAVAGNKRSADSTDDSEGENSSGPKKAKQEDGEGVLKKPTPGTIDAGKEAAMEAEVRAARERAMVPLEVRVKRFREMLAEKEVSAFSTWEKELHKIVFDSRYLVLTSKERKQVFDKYIRERAEEERKEKRNRLRQKKDDFRALMEDAKLHSKSSFSDFAGKYGKDERFKGVEKMREREALFNEYVVEIRKREKEEKSQKREQIKKDFFALLKESKDVDRHSRWADVKKKLDSDPRYKAVDGSAMREDYFRDYVRILKDERKKEKDKDRDSSRKKDKKDRDRDRDRDDKDKDRDKDKSKKDRKDSHRDGETEGEEEEEDPEVVKERNEAAAAREKAARAEASIKEREREVQRVLATSLRDRDKEREYHKRDEAVQHFNALLADLVRNPELSWREVKKQLKKDHRWGLAELLSKEDKEGLFVSHTESLSLKRRDKFREMLDELGSKVSLTSSWRDVRKLVKDDPRYTKFSNADKCEREFKEYIKDRTSNAKQQFRILLQETRTLTHKSLATVKDQPSHLADIESQLSQDARYLVLDHLSDERKQIIMMYLEELDKRGPPPPPTASEPSRRSAK